MNDNDTVNHEQVFAYRTSGLEMDVHTGQQRRVSPAGKSKKQGQSAPMTIAPGTTEMTKAEFAAAAGSNCGTTFRLIHALRHQDYLRVERAEIIYRVQSGRLQAQGYTLSIGKNVGSLSSIAEPVLDSNVKLIAGVKLTIRGGQLPAAACAILQGPYAQQVAQEFVRPVLLSQCASGLRR